MTVMAELGSTSIPDLLDDLNAAEGFRAEYVEGTIIVTPAPSHDHEDIAANLLRQFILSDLAFVYPGGRGFCKRADCTDERKGNHVIPDLSVASRAFRDAEIAAADAHKNWMSADALDLVVEITSQNRLADTSLKVRAYGRMAIPRYLLVDRTRREVVLYTQPTGDAPEPGYAAQQAFPFGRIVPLPSPYPDVETKTWQ